MEVLIWLVLLRNEDFFSFRRTPKIYFIKYEGTNCLKPKTDFGTTPIHAASTMVLTAFRKFKLVTNQVLTAMTSGTCTKKKSTWEQSKTICRYIYIYLLTSENCTPWKFEELRQFFFFKKTQIKNYSIIRTKAKMPKVPVPDMISYHIIRSYRLPSLCPILMI